jgi:3',5'-cyclic AMP phosphodiesterase CpdA
LASFQQIPDHGGSTINPKGSAAMLIAQMSDPHFLPEGMLAYGKLDVAGCLERTVAHLNALEPDVVLITGDLTSDGDEQVYAAFAAIGS